VIVRAFHPPGHDLAWLTDTFRAADCFYCCQPITEPFVVWLGYPRAISVHPPCVVELTIGLLRDVHEFECGSYDYVTGRMARLRA
jgi:hypothetical protein